MADDSYLIAEQTTVDYLVDKLDADKFNDAYPGALKAHIYDAWAFRITGGTASDNLCPGSVSTFAEISARYNERGDALEFISKLRTVFNVTGLILSDVGENVQQLQLLDDEAEIGEDTIQTNAQGRTVTRPVTTVTLPLHIMFTL